MSLANLILYNKILLSSIVIITAILVFYFEDLDLNFKYIISDDIQRENLL